MQKRQVKDVCCKVLGGTGQVGDGEERWGRSKESKEKEGGRLNI